MLIHRRDAENADGGTQENEEARGRGGEGTGRRLSESGFAGFKD